MDFPAWLAQQTGRDDSIGDLARETAADPDWPPAIVNRPSFRSYFEARDAPAGAFAALHAAMLEWRGTQ
jgi:hypothetical protein